MSENIKNIEPEKWVDNYGNYLYNYAWIRVGSKETAEDLIQDTFISALKSKDKFKGKSSELTWLISILKHKVIDYYRKNSNKKEFSESSFRKPFQDKNGMEGHWIMERAPKDWDKNDNALHQEEFQTILMMCLSGLPEKWRSVFVLKVMEEMESDKICEEIGCTASNFWVIMHRAKLKLRECIEKNWIK